MLTAQSINVGVPSSHRALNIYVQANYRQRIFIGEEQPITVVYRSFASVGLPFSVKIPGSILLQPHNYICMAFQLVALCHTRQLVQ